MAKATASVYLKIVDKNRQVVEGECYDRRHMGEISLTSWDWSVTDPTQVRKQEAAATAPHAALKSKLPVEGEADDKIQPSLFKITKQTDKSTVRLLNALDRGEIFPKATLCVEEEFEEAENPFKLTIELSDVFLMSIGWNASASGAGRDFSENWELNYRTIDFAYEWRGTPPATIPAQFDRPPDSKQGSTQKAPLTDKEIAKLRQKADEAPAATSRRPGK